MIPDPSSGFVAPRSLTTLFHGNVLTFCEAPQFCWLKLETETPTYVSAVSQEAEPHLDRPSIYPPSDNLGGRREGMIDFVTTALEYIKQSLCNTMLH